FPHRERASGPRARPSWRAYHAILLLSLLSSACSPRLADTVPLRLVHRELVQADSLEEVYGLRLDDPSGDTVTAFLRLPAPERRAGERLPAIVLVAGRETGRQAAAVIPGPIDAVVLAVE